MKRLFCGAFYLPGWAQTYVFKEKSLTSSSRHLKLMASAGIFRLPNQEKTTTAYTALKPVNIQENNVDFLSRRAKSKTLNESDSWKTVAYIIGEEKERKSEENWIWLSLSVGKIKEEWASVYVKKIYFVVWLARIERERERREGLLNMIFLFYSSVR